MVVKQAEVPHLETKNSMIKLYTWNTPNGYKVPIMLEECGIEYEIITVNIAEGEQHKPKYLKLNPNNKIPTIIDVKSASDQIVIFESGAILLYLAEKSGKFLPKNLRGKYQVMEWLMFQMGGIGPMLGQAAHFIQFAPEKVEYGIKRYGEEAKRIYSVLEKRLKTEEYLAGKYSIADMAAWPWVRGYEMTGIKIANFPHVKKWLDRIAERPAVKRALKKVDEAVDKSM
jgi:GSH-dependent disulfide-bond oxidoreductase